MKTEQLKSRKILAISQVLASHPEVFEGKSEALLLRDAFISNSETLQQKINLLVLSAQTLIAHRVEKRARYRDLLNHVAQLGVMLGSRKQDAELVLSFTEILSRLRSVSIARMLAMGDVVNTHFTSNMDQLLQLGLIQADWEEFTSLHNSMLETLNNTEDRVSNRRALRAEINSLIKQQNQLLRMDLDRFVRHHAVLHRAFADRYMRIRRARRKHATPELPVDSDISGQVTDSLSGGALQGALITLIEHTYSIETDADGRFMFDELPEGSYTVSCHMPGYLVPEQMQITLGRNDSVIHNFVLDTALEPAA
ncbi:MAG: carboxypeptidase-like regulatory domain-containing protein [Bacteroidetes bacterium]|jgi:hypothetical protein|nr:carboxypeptidase-like regulatory domain-containing protein [Bacteroidota bacterium]